MRRRAVAASRSAAPRRAARPRPKLVLAVQRATRGWLPANATLRRWALAALAHPAEITLRIVGSAEARRLNLRYRGRRYIPDVLSFGYGRFEGRLLGDVVLCAPVIRRQARAQGKTLEAHFAHLTVHGLLHLQGYDHARAAEARGMERCETRILRELGYPDPYRDDR